MCQSQGILNYVHVCIRFNSMLFLFFSMAYLIVYVRVCAYFTLQMKMLLQWCVFFYSFKFIFHLVDFLASSIANVRNAFVFAWNRISSLFCWHTICISFSWFFFFHFTLSLLPGVCESILGGFHAKVFSDWRESLKREKKNPTKFDTRGNEIQWNVKLIAILFLAHCILCSCFKHRIDSKTAFAHLEFVICTQLPFHFRIVPYH